jgi:predicted phage baseplate assembly protein
MAALLNRAPRTIRHRGRAVTSEDYEDLALLTSSEVARARCVPLRNLIDDPLDEKSAVPGAVSVIIIPRLDHEQPQPSVELIDRVQNYLERYSVPTTTVFVVGPLYIRVNVTAEIALTSLDRASEVERVVYQKLVDFLHPLTGGLDGAGWDFGREPHASDLYALLGAVPGVDHVISLATQESADPPSLDLKKVRSTRRFLVYSGTHEIKLVLEGS